MTTNELREIDAWIAEHVMGAKENPRFSGSVIGITKVWLDTRTYETFSPTEISDYAMEVLEKCIGKGVVNLRESSNGYFIDKSPANPPYVYAEAETLPLAICLFAKKLFSK